MWIQLAFVLHAIVLLLVVSALGLQSLRIQSKFYLHPRIVSFMLPFVINFILAQTVFSDLYPLFTTLVPSLVILYIAIKMEGVKVIGLTGGVGTGKSTLIKLIKQNYRYIKVIEGEEIWRQLCGKGKPGYKAIMKILGDRSEQYVHHLTGEIQRESLSKLIINNPEIREKVHTKMGKLLSLRLIVQIFGNISRKKNVILIQSPLLLEMNIRHFCFPIIMVGCEPQLQIQRLTQRDGCSEQEARARIDSEMSERDRKRRTNIYIDNNGSKQNLEKQFFSKTRFCFKKDKFNHVVS